MTDVLEEIKALRAKLHETPRLSGQEADSAALLEQFLRAHTTLEIQRYDNRMICLYRGKPEEETVAFRADLDAIPGESGPYHGCGHDGHSAVLAGVALWLEAHKPEKNVVLLFQNSEETGEGAKPLRDLALESLHIDRIYGLHNLPGFPAGMILSRSGTFACASRGFIAEVTGSQSHAAYPEQGRNPAELLSRAVLALPESLSGSFWSLALWGGLAATAVEYAVHVLYDRLLGVRFWDYSQVRWNLRGRVCLPFSLAWSLLVAAGLPVIQAAIAPALAAVPPTATYAALLVFTADTVVSLQLLRRAGDPAVLSLGNLRAA